jgi:hypothetical protein
LFILNVRVAHFVLITGFMTNRISSIYRVIYVR